jgi:hypothetical protein
MLTRGAYSRQIQEEAYRKLFDQPPASSHVRLFKRGSLSDPRLLGDAKFISDVWRQTGRRSPDLARRARDLEADIPAVVTQLIERFNALYGPRNKAARTRIVTYEDLRSRSRKRPLPMVRALSVSYLLKHKIATPAQASRFFGCGPRPVSASRRRFYETLFRECFGAKPEILFCPYPGGRSVAGDQGQHDDGA